MVSGDSRKIMPTRGSAHPPVEFPFGEGPERNVTDSRAAPAARCLPPQRPFPVLPSPATPGCPRSRLHLFLGDGLPVSGDAPACAQAHMRLPQRGRNPSRGIRRIRVEVFDPGSHGRLRARPDQARASIPPSSCPTRGGPPYWPENATRIPAEAIGPLACPDPERLRRGVNLFRGRTWQLDRQYSFFVLVYACQVLQE